MDVTLLAIRIFIVIVLYAFLGIVLVMLIREQHPSQAPEPRAASLVRLSQDEPVSQDAGMTVAYKPVFTSERHRLASHGPTWIGRDPNCAVRVNGEFVSTRHAHIDWRGDKQAWWIEDNTSRNGTLVNGQRIMRSELQHADIISIGGVQFRFEVER